MKAQTTTQSETMTWGNKQTQGLNQQQFKINKLQNQSISNNLK